MPPRQNLLFLQLPRLDHDVDSPGENLMLAAACLGSALARQDEGRHWRVGAPLAGQDELDNQALLAALLARPPDVLAATLYLWNVERTLHLLAALRRHRPRVRVVVGGPEVAFCHPFLYRHGDIDAAVVGEGEQALPAILHAFRGAPPPDQRNILWREGRRFHRGSQTVELPALRDLLPPPAHPVNRPDAAGMAYLETSRGCPLHCAFCCYNLRRRRCSTLAPAEVAARVRVLRRRGAREIRLVDPTFNAHPDFEAVLAVMRRANRDRRTAFFVELRADTLTARQAAALAAANVREAEVGVQSCDPDVLRLIRRPAATARLATGLDQLVAAGIRPTIDFMFGLPGQGRDDIEQALAWCDRYPGAHAQLLPTLLLPGTELRDRRRALGLVAQARPPYRVLATPQLPPAAMLALEARIAERLGSFDTPTRRFVGRRLPDLFAERIRLDAAELRERPPPPAGRANRRAVLLRGNDLFNRRAALASLIRDWVAREPDLLWQFVLAPAAEEPLDLIEELIAVLHALPTHWLDRLVSPVDGSKRVARRLFLLLPARCRVDPAWVAAAEDRLAAAFH